jgi:hypothetical protein
MIKKIVKETVIATMIMFGMAMGGAALIIGLYNMFGNK